MTAPAFEEVPMPEPAVREVYATSQNTPSVKAGFEMGGYVKSPDYYTADQLRTYGDQRANAALEEAAKLRKLIADHNDECVRMCEARTAAGRTYCPMQGYRRQCQDCPKEGMVEVRADTGGVV